DVYKRQDLDSEVLSDLEIFHGGAAANFAVGAARLGLKVGMIGCVGNDAFGISAIEELNKNGVSIDFIKIVEGKRTGMVCVIVEKSGNRRMIAYRGANEALESSIDRIPDSKYLQLCNVSRKVLIKVKNMTNSKISLDPGGSIVELKPNDLKGIDIVFMNEIECRKLTGMDYSKGAELISNYVNLVIIKRGAKGAYLFDGKNSISMPAMKVNVVDTTGAGDAFDAGFLAAMIKGRSLNECLSWGIATASIKIQKKGARSGLPTLEELLKFLSNY
ncbi:MAG: carbohydrate kinase family protein, partial [Candidatus Methanomethyliaceae archaeon]|nr:carbohydrate kinase family protein [Candidatus Methanomethyliaceae archaeon]